MVLCKGVGSVSGRAALDLVALTFLLTLVLVPEAAAAPAWGACGRSTPEDKVVRVFPSPQGPLTLLCGGPIDSDTPT